MDNLFWAMSASSMFSEGSPTFYRLSSVIPFFFRVIAIAGIGDRHQSELVIGMPRITQQIREING
jgi:hypothetical protein